MTRFLPLLAAALVLALPSATAQTVVYEETFETDGNPARYTTSVPEFLSTNSNNDFFFRTDGTGLSGSYNVSGQEGDFWFAAQDVDGDGGPNRVSITLADIDITTITGNLSVSALYAEDEATDGNPDWDGSDEVELYASIDGGSEFLILSIQGGASSGTSLPTSVDRDFDGVGDGAELLTSTFTEFATPIAQTGGVLSLRYEIQLNGGDEDIAIDRIRVSGDTALGQTAIVSFSSAGGDEIAEDGGSTMVDVVLTTDDDKPLEAPVSGTVDVTVGTNDGDVMVMNGSFSFPAGSAGMGTVTQTVTVTATDDMTFEGDEDFELGFATLSGAVGGNPPTFAFTVLDDEQAPQAPPVRISEVDARTADDDGGGDDYEFIELTGPPNYDLDGLVIVLLDGGDGLTNNDFDLTGCSTDVNGVFVIGDENIVGTTDGCSGSTGRTRALFNGCSNCNKLADGPDAVLLFVGEGSDFNNNDDIPTAAAAAGAQLFDVYAWGVNRSRQNADFLDVIETFPGFSDVVQHDESYEGDRDVNGVSRLVVIDGMGANLLSDLFYPMPPTPGVLNASTLTVDLADPNDLFNPSTADGDGADWRLLAAPVVQADASPFAVGDLAGLNLVQGVAAGGGFPASYPGAEPNIYTAFTGASGDPSGYAAPASTGTPVSPGDGFFWYWYDADIDPGGASVSYELTPVSDGGSFDYSFTGIPVDDRLASALLGAPLAVNVDVYADPAGGMSRFGIVGNPFAYPYRLGGVTTDAGTLSTTYQAYEPGAGYSVLIADDIDPFVGDAIGVGEGAFFEVTDVTEGQTITLSASSVFVDPTIISDDFNGRHAASDRVTLRLTGELVDGFATVDRAAVVRRVADAVDGWDRHDASKLRPLGARRALLAPVGSRDGAPNRQAVVSLPAEADAEVRLAFSATEAGTYTISADDLPTADAVSLRDDATGQVVDLASGAYTFAADATAWTERFTLAIGSVLVGNEDRTERTTALSRPAPNPTRGVARLRLTSADADMATVVVVDALGRTVATLHEGALPAGGAVDLTVDTARLAPGLYVIRAAAGADVHTQTLTVVR